MAGKINVPCRYCDSNENDVDALTHLLCVTIEHVDRLRRKEENYRDIAIKVHSDDRARNRISDFVPDNSIYIATFVYKNC